MYVFYIKKGSSKSYIPYTVIEDVVTQDAYGNDVTTKVEKIWTTDDLEELAEKYKELLSLYTVEQLKPVQELEPSILIEITD